MQEEEILDEQELYDITIILSSGVVLRYNGVSNPKLQNTSYAQGIGTVVTFAIPATHELRTGSFNPMQVAAAHVTRHGVSEGAVQVTTTGGALLI